MPPGDEAPLGMSPARRLHAVPVLAPKIPYWPQASVMMTGGRLSSTEYGTRRWQ